MLGMPWCKGTPPNAQKVLVAGLFLFVCKQQLNLPVSVVRCRLLATHNSSNASTV